MQAGRNRAEPSRNAGLSGVERARGITRNRKGAEKWSKSPMIQKRPLKPPVKNMPFAFSTSALLLPELYSTLRTEFEAQDGAMLHGAMINLRRRIVNQARGFPCRAAAQFNERPPADAGTALPFAIEHHWPGTTEAGCSA